MLPGGGPVEVKAPRNTAGTIAQNTFRSTIGAVPLPCRRGWKGGMSASAQPVQYQVMLKIHSHSGPSCTSPVPREMTSEYVPAPQPNGLWPTRADIFTSGESDSESSHSMRNGGTQYVDYAQDPAG